VRAGEEVARAHEVAQLGGVVEPGDALHAARGVETGALLRRDARERLDRHDRDAVGGEPAGDLVEQRAHAHEVGVQHQAELGRAVGLGVDGLDRGAVVGLELHALDAPAPLALLQERHPVSRSAGQT
jgi:hypothetical protein